jgi:hypothetical protein
MSRSRPAGRHVPRRMCPVYPRIPDPRTAETGIPASERVSLPDRRTHRGAGTLGSVSAAPSPGVGAPNRAIHGPVGGSVDGRERARTWAHSA